MAKIPNSREEREGTGRRRAPGGRRRLAVQAKRREREREGGGEGVFNPNNSHPKRLNYP